MDKFALDSTADWMELNDKSSQHTRHSPHRIVCVARLNRNRVECTYHTPDESNTHTHTDVRMSTTLTHTCDDGAEPQLIQRFMGVFIKKVCDVTHTWTAIVKPIISFAHRHRQRHSSSSTYTYSLAAAGEQQRPTNSKRIDRYVIITMSGVLSIGCPFGGVRAETHSATVVVVVVYTFILYTHIDRAQYVHIAQTKNERTGQPIHRHWRGEYIYTYSRLCGDGDERDGIIHVPYSFSIRRNETCTIHECDEKRR